MATKSGPNDHHWKGGRTMPGLGKDDPRPAPGSRSDAKAREDFAVQQAALNKQQRALSLEEKALAKARAELEADRQAVEEERAELERRREEVAAGARETAA